jgi:hypothetical protein
MSQKSTETVDGVDSANLNAPADQTQPSIQPMMSTMRAMVLDRPGTPLTLRERPVPQPGEGEILIEVKLMDHRFKMRRIAWTRGYLALKLAEKRTPRHHEETTEALYRAKASAVSCRHCREVRPDGVTSRDGVM